MFVTVDVIFQLDQRKIGRPGERRFYTFSSLTNCGGMLRLARLLLQMQGQAIFTAQPAAGRSI